MACPVNGIKRSINSNKKSNTLLKHQQFYRAQPTNSTWLRHWASLFWLNTMLLVSMSVCSNATMVPLKMTSLSVTFCQVCSILFDQATSIQMIGCEAGRCGAVLYFNLLQFHSLRYIHMCISPSLIHVVPGF